MENYLKEMLVTLAESGVEFVVGGGVACVLHGVERVTLDLDIAVNMTNENMSRLILAVGKLGLKPRVPVPLADLRNPEFVRAMVVEKGALVFSLVDFDKPLRHLDIFLSPNLSYEKLGERAEAIDIGGVEVRIASKAKLVELKESIRPRRPKDVLDLHELAKLIEERPS